ncbi:hypothetical protein RF11_12268 [Thelohanellus kitauei]|uniref:Uncharacterized protein n=1 Tax=Thelohanellus kitauei TaxID=669202 RepID=A0A0C2MZH0_THEKT|nr:hypothetical protein RF11_12268 [Thelohanellus kitauei]
MALSAENSNANFGDAHRKGTKNIYANLRTAVGLSHLLSFGCSVNILHKSMQTAVNAYHIMLNRSFARYTSTFVFTLSLWKSSKIFANLAASNTGNFLATQKSGGCLMPSVKRILLIYDGLMSYFSLLSHCRTVIQEFFGDPLSETWIYFVH